MATVGISLVRRFVERIRPPRYLHCEFPFGRPLGRPGDAVFQHRVLGALLGLLDAEEGPVLADFPESIQGEGAGGASLACPVPASMGPDTSKAVAEVEALWPAYRRATAETSDAGRKELVVEAVQDLTGIIDGGHTDLPAVEIQDRAIQIRRYYERAAISLSNEVLGAHAFEEWFFDSTDAGALIRRCQVALVAAGRPREDWRHLTPRAYRHDPQDGRIER